MRLKIIYDKQKYLINFTNDNLSYIREYLREFFDIRYNVHLEIDGFRVTQGALKEDDIVDVIKTTLKRDISSSSSSSSSSSDSSSSSSSSSTSDSSEDEEEPIATTSTQTVPPYTGTTKTHKRNLRNKKKLKFQKLENQPVTPYSSLPLNSIPKNVRITSVDVEDKHFEPGNYTLHADFHNDEKQESSEENPMIDEQSGNDLAPSEEPIVSSNAAASKTSQGVTQLQPGIHYLGYGMGNQHDTLIDQFITKARKKMESQRPLTDLPKINAFVGYQELQLDNQRRPENLIMIAKIVGCTEEVVTLLRCYFTHGMLEMSPNESITQDEMIVEMTLNDLIQSNAVIL